MKGPTPYVPEMARFWWLHRRGYRRYMLRELTCVWVGAWIGVMIVGLIRLAQGPAAWDAFRQALGSGPGLVFQALALLFVVYHTVTWFALAPSTMPLRLGERRVPPRLIEAAHYAVWGIVTMLILFFAGV